MSTFALYLPGESPLHRMPAGAKLLGLAAVAMVGVVIRQPWQVALVIDPHQPGDADEIGDEVPCLVDQGGLEGPGTGRKLHELHGHLRP